MILLDLRFALLLAKFRCQFVGVVFTTNTAVKTRFDSLYNI